MDDFGLVGSGLLGGSAYIVPEHERQQYFDGISVPVKVNNWLKACRNISSTWEWWVFLSQAMPMLLLLPSEELGFVTPACLKPATLAHFRVNRAP